ncbi:tyrosine/serine protein phosphatase [Annulohypoxylon maeteangense]|uniref:tyrosine/serine protein phosphatase n=1 Tax=Annulohypoxylon maeteangense TaxID=1927788 RepID=UPI0020073A44|nr:tyrosine/serine protein phosphatase [Annulohypoxylon maeteangense]KAI0885258.1 tyrosine/serine protein phosphatase [Annulohypoxylon maeteangense]
MSVVFDNILNFRDVGKTVNDHLGRKLVREGVLYRSARPDEASPEDRKRLRDEFGIKTVVDLRTKTEHARQAEKRQASQTNLSEPNATSESAQIPGVRYQQIKITGRRFEKFLVSQLSWWNYFKLIFLFLFRYRMQAISLISREILLPRGLVGLGLVTIDQSGVEIADTLRIIIAPSSTPLLVHCTQGKDRTGVIIALVLMVLSVPASAIDHDYMLTRAGLSSERESRLEEIREIGLTAEWGDVSPEFVERVAEHIDVKYGGIGGYLDSVGFDASERQRLVEVLGA